MVLLCSWFVGVHVSWYFSMLVLRLVLQLARYLARWLGLLLVHQKV